MTPIPITQETPPEPKWCAACGKWGDHTSGTCPTIRHPHQESAPPPPDDLIPIAVAASDPKRAEALFDAFHGTKPAEPIQPWMREAAREIHPTRSSGNHRVLNTASIIAKHAPPDSTALLREAAECAIRIREIIDEEKFPQDLIWVPTIRAHASTIIENLQFPLLRAHLAQCTPKPAATGGEA